MFVISPTGGFTTLYNFDGTSGETPSGGLALDGSGNFFGTTEFGGVNDRG